MKILFTVQNYYPRMSGVPVVVRYLAEGLYNKGHEVSVVTRGKSELGEYEIYNGINIYRFDINFSKLKGHYGEIEKYIQFVKNFDCDVVINECTQCETTDLLLKYLDDIKAKKILHAHGFAGLKLRPIKKMNSIKHTLGNTYNYIRWNIYYNKFKEYIVKYDELICLSQKDSGKPYMELHGKNDVQILENAANDVFFNKTEERLNIKKYIPKIDKDYIISVANYIPTKNQGMILEAFYKTKDSNYSLVLIGSKKTLFYNKLLKKKMKLDDKYGDRDVYILTNVDRDDIPNLIGHAKIYLSSSTHEEYSISIIEAMAKGVPFISTDVGNASILPGGIIINTVEEMTNKIEYLLNNENKRKTLGREGAEYAISNCRESIAINKLEKLISKVVN